MINLRSELGRRKYGRSFDRGPPAGGAIQVRADSRPLAGAEVRIGEFGLASTTDSAGRYRLVVPGGRFQVQVRKIGFVSQVRTLTVLVADPIQMDVTLFPAPQELPGITGTGCGLILLWTRYR